MESRVSTLLRPYLSLLLLVADDKAQDYDLFKQMVKDVNLTQVGPEEILSFNLYRYDREKDIIEQITV